MLDLLSHFYKPLSLGIVVALALITSFLEGIDGIAQYIDRYLSDVVGWLGVAVLFWLWKFEKDWKQDLKSKLSALEASLHCEVNENEERIKQLWNVFRKHATDAELEEGIREILIQYPSIVLQQKDLKIGEKVQENIMAAGNILQRREYSVYFDAMNVYPGPFYEIAKKSIIATNIGGPRNFWQARKSLVKMNEGAAGRIQPTLQKGEDAIRRVFIIEEGAEMGEIDALKQLMKELDQVGVVIKYIGLERAQQLVIAHASHSIKDHSIKGLKDFTVFDTEYEDLKYAGRFQDLGADHKEIIVSSDPQIIEGLTDQFQVLWNDSVRFKGEIDLSLLSSVKS